MTWYAVYRKADGGLVSVGTIVTAELSPDLAVKTYTTKPDFGSTHWDAAALDFVANPAPVPDDVLQTALSVLNTDLSGANTAQILAWMVKVLRFLGKQALRETGAL